MSSRRTPLRWEIVAAAALGLTALGLAALASVTGIAQSRSTHSGAKARAPLRAILYHTVPIRLSGLTGRPRPSLPRDDRAAIARHLAALKWAHADAAIVPWSPPASAADRKLGAVLAAIASTRARVRVVALLDRPRGTEDSQIQALAARRAKAPGYLRIGARPAVFVALADRSLRGCGRALRWRSAARGFWLAQATFPGYGHCRAAADAWFRDEPDSRNARATGTFLIRPGYWPLASTAPTLGRSPDLWQRSIVRMSESGAPVQIIDSLNDWAHGTALEPSATWRSNSGFGSYLDALHAHPPGVPPRAAAPTVDAVAISGIAAHTASVTAAVSAGSAAAAWWVEFGATTAYGQMTAPVTLPAMSSRRPLTATLTALSASTTYHARLVVASSVGTVKSPDSAFTTLADPRTRSGIAAAGDIACDPADPGTTTAVPVTQRTAASDTSRTARQCRAHDAVLPLGDLQYESGTPSRFRRRRTTRAGAE